MTAKTQRLAKTAEEAFDEYAAKYDHDSDVWLDMDVMTFFKAGWAAARAEALQEHIKIVEGVHFSYMGDLTNVQAAQVAKDVILGSLSAKGRAPYPTAELTN